MLPARSEYRIAPAWLALESINHILCSPAVATVKRGGDAFTATGVLRFTAQSKAGRKMPRLMNFKNSALWRDTVAPYRPFEFPRKLIGNSQSFHLLP